jgi:hypothetical protein
VSGARVAMAAVVFPCTFFKLIALMEQAAFLMYLRKKCNMIRSEHLC